MVRFDVTYCNGLRVEVVESEGVAADDLLVLRFEDVERVLK